MGWWAAVKMGLTRPSPVKIRDKGSVKTKKKLVDMEGRPKAVTLRRAVL